MTRTEGRGVPRRGRVKARSFRLWFVLMAGLGLALAGVIAAVTLVGSAVLVDSSWAAADLAESRRTNDAVLVDLVDLHDLVAPASTTAVSDIDELARSIREGGALAGDLVDGDQLDEAISASSAAAEQAIQAASALGKAGPAATPEVIEAERLAHVAAITAHDQLAAGISAAQRRAQDDVASRRQALVVAVLVVLVVGGLAVLTLAVRRGDQQVTRAKDVGSAMRRFADGDLGARSDEAPDDLGALARSFNALADASAARFRELRDDAERVTQLRVISEALDLAVDEEDVERILEHAISILTPRIPVEVLLTDRNGTDLHQVVVHPTMGPPNCPVASTGQCVAARWGRTVTFDRPDDLNACPMLRNRPTGPCSAVCVPVSTGGAVIGVVHATGEPGDPPSPAIVEQLVTLASRSGTRIGSVRLLEQSRHQASTDTLTGLANRRRLETMLHDLLRTATPFVLVMADIDHFKGLNDRYGHEVGDRALRAFAAVLKDNVRDHDLVARFGGEEFVLVYPRMELSTSAEVLDRMRRALAQTLEASDLPAFTASFGVTLSGVATDPDAIIRVADAGLLAAKETGRNRVVFSDADLAAEVFAVGRHPGAPLQHVLSDPRQSAAIEDTADADVPIATKSDPVVAPYSPGSDERRAIWEVHPRPRLGR